MGRAPPGVSLLVAIRLSLAAPTQFPWMAVTLVPKCAILCRTIHCPGHPGCGVVLGRFSMMNDNCPPLTSSPTTKLLCFDGFTSSNSLAVAFLMSGQQFVAPDGAGIGPTDALCMWRYSMRPL